MLRFFCEILSFAGGTTTTMTAKKVEAPRVVKTIAAAAKALGVHERTLKQWLTDPECPRSRGKYDVEAIRAWRDANKKPGASADSPRAKWETRKARAEALAKELDLRTRSGQLIRVDRAAQVVARHIAEVVTHLDQLPDFAVAGVRLAAATKKIVRERVRQKIDDLRATVEKSLRALAAATNGQETP